MTFLPIVERELRVASRRRGTYRARSGAALLGIALTAWMFLISFRLPSPDLGKVIFSTLSSVSFLYSLLAGVRTTADCLSEEKRDGTLGLLFLTDLKGYDVVFGKLVATSLTAFYGLLAILPVLALPLMLGGVTSRDFQRMAAALTNTLFFSLAAGLLVSSVSRQGRKAMGGTFLLVLFFTAGLPALGGWLAYIHVGLIDSNVSFLQAPSPFYSYLQAFGTAGPGRPDRFWLSLAVIHGFAWVFLILASLRIPRSWQDKPLTAKGARWRMCWQYWSHGDAAARSLFRKHLLDSNAFFWLAARDRLKPAYVWAFLGMVFCIWVWGAIKFRADWFSEEICLMTAIFLNSMLKFWVAAESGRRFGEDRRNGSLELLLSTPLSVPDILRGQMLALRRQFLIPIITVLVVDFFFLLLALHGEAWAGDRTLWGMTWLAGMAMFFADLLALCWTGMWDGLTAKHANRAGTSTVFRILVLPWLVFMVILTFGALVYYRGQFSPDGKFLLALWFCLGIFNDLAFGLLARHRLHGEFRTIATLRFSLKAPRGLWRWVHPAEAVVQAPPLISSRND